MQIKRFFHYRSVLVRCRISFLTLLFLFASYLAPVFAEPAPNSLEKDDLDMLIESLIRTHHPLLLKENLVDRVIENGKQYLGRPYRFRNPKGDIMDCSGFVGYIYSLEGIKLPRTSRQMSSMVTRVPITEVQKGDLLFFTGTSAKSKTVGHVSMVIDTTDGKIRMIHSSSRGVVIDDYPTQYYGRRFMHAGRIPELESSFASSAAIYSN